MSAPEMDGLYRQGALAKAGWFGEAASSRLAAWLCAFGVVLVAVCNFAVGLERPAGPIWDESYYLTSTQRYLEGRAQFASHPPLGLMLIAAGAAVSGANRGVDTHGLADDKTISGAALPHGFDFTGVRLAPAVFAILGALAFYLLMLNLTEGVGAAAVFTNLYLFETAFAAQFRAGQLDAFQMCFTICALLAFVRATRVGPGGTGWLPWCLSLALVCALASMVKANGVVLTVLGLILAGRTLVHGWRGGPWRALLRGARDGASMAGVFIATAVAVFTLHVAISPRALDYGSPAAAKDARYIEPAYDDYLRGRRSLSPAVVIAAADGYRRFMAADFAGTPRDDANGSPVWLWPLGQRTINYRWDSDGDRTGYVQLVGNPVGLATGLMALAGAFLVLVTWRVVRDARRLQVIAALSGLWVALMLVHGWLGQARVLYLYHYFMALIVSFALAPLIFSEACERFPLLGRNKFRVMGTATALLLLGFLVYAPLTRGQLLTHAACEARNTLGEVVICRP